MLPEQRLWASILDTCVEDALNIFTLKGDRTLEEQYADIYRERGVKKFPILSLECQRARLWMESSGFDDVVDLVGYDSEFVKRTFEYVQRAITLEKKLYEVTNSKRKVEEFYA